MKLTCFQFIFFCLSVKEIAETVSRDRLYLHSAHALQLQIPTILKRADNSFERFELAGGLLLLIFFKLLTFDLSFQR